GVVRCDLYCSSALMEIAFLIVGFALGALLVWLVGRERLGSLRAQVEHERASGDEKAAFVEAARTELGTTMKALAADALQRNNESFLHLAQSKLAEKEKAVEHLVAPLKESLDRVSREVETLERERQKTVGALTAGLRAVADTSERVRVQTADLATALRAPEVRGAWGQMQLRNAVEAAGMLEYCDFEQEVTVR